VLALVFVCLVGVSVAELDELVEEDVGGVVVVDAGVPAALGDVCSTATTSPAPAAQAPTAVAQPRRWLRRSRRFGGGVLIMAITMRSPGSG
jgi:hypothetical protein